MFSGRRDQVRDARAFVFWAHVPLCSLLFLTGTKEEENERLVPWKNPKEVHDPSVKCLRHWLQLVTLLEIVCGRWNVLPFLVKYFEQKGASI